MPAKAADVKWSKGNSWEYGWNATEEGIFTMLGTLDMKVTETTSTSYVTTLSGSATGSGELMNMSMSATVTISGSIVRDKSNFGTTSTTFIMNMTATAGVLSMKIEVGVMTTSTPALNDLPINQMLAPGTHIWSNSTVTGTMWFNIAGLSNSTQTISSTEHLELIVGANQTITTPAGTFECVKLTTGSGLNSTTYYYSEKVGNYVKATGTGSMDAGFGALGGLELKSYSYGGGSSGIMSLITGKYWWVTALIIVVIVVAIIGLVVMRRRGRGQPTTQPTQQTPPPPQQ
jgi:hypothetical protein